jgi:hypothetical protein
MSHSIQEDFEHFLSYSGLRKESAEVIDKLRQAFEAAWKFYTMDIDTARGVAARIWCDQDYSHVLMNAGLAERIAYLLMDEANTQIVRGLIKSKENKHV